MRFEEEKLLKEFIKITGDKRLSNDLINHMRMEYLLITKEDRRCSYCIHCQKGNGFCHPEYCVKLDKSIYDEDISVLCDYYRSGGEEARKSLARSYCKDDQLIY